MLSSNLDKIMIEKRVSFRDMVRKTGLSGETINRARKNKINCCTLKTLEKIAAYLKCDIKDLFDE